MEGPVQVRTFALDKSGTPSIEAMMQAADPAELRQLYETLGLKSLAANADKHQRAQAASQTYEELPKADFALYHSFLTHVVPLQDLTVPPPTEVVEVLAAAKQVELFDAIVVRRHPDTQESLLLGQVSDGQGMRYFKIAHWGTHLTHIEELRKRQRKDHAFGRKLKKAKWPRISFGMFDADKRGPVYFGALALLATGLCWWLLLSGIVGWWAFMGILLTLAIGYTNYADSNNRSTTPGNTAATIAVLSAIAGIVMGFVTLDNWMNQTYTVNALVCSISQNSDSTNTSWDVDTSSGALTLQGGFYNGTYYPNGTKQLAQSFVGDWVTFTAHGQTAFDQTGTLYVTKATTVRPGNCGQS